MTHAHYRIYDTPFRIETDTPAFLAGFDVRYGRFRAPRGDGLLFRVTLADPPTLAHGGEVVTGRDPRALAAYAANAVLRAVAARVVSHFLVHAAALRDPSGGGVVIAGASGFGKTTLALALRDRGWGVLSDDIAALDRTDRLVHAFPRSICRRVAGGSLDVKEVADIGELPAPSPLRRLVLLDDGGADDVRSPIVSVLVDRVDGLQAAMACIAGVREVTAQPGPGYPVLRLHLDGVPPAAVEEKVEQACRAQGVLLLDLTRGVARRPDFGDAPRLDRISTVDAARELLPHLRSPAESRLVQEIFGGSGARLLLALTEAIDGARCFRLTVGRLDETVDLLERS